MVRRAVKLKEKSARIRRGRADPDIIEIGARAMPQINKALRDRAREVLIEDEVARRAIRLRGNGNERTGPCPVCGGDDRFSINLEKQVWFCRKCQKGGDVISLVKHLDGVEFRDAIETLAGEPGAIRPKPKLATKIVAEYAYTDEHGALLFQSVRYEPKAFKQRCPDGNGGWIPNLNGVRRVLYRLPDVIEAVKRGTTIHIVEGEKDADSLRDLGFAATTNPGGANKWRPEYNEFLHDADVVVTGDHDEPGRKHVQQVAQSLTGVVKRVRVLDLAKHWPQCPDGGDISDWLKSGGDTAQLAAWIESAPEAKKHGPELVSKCASEYKMRSISWLWKHRFAVGKLGLLADCRNAVKG
jgi:DNA primase